MRNDSVVIKNRPDIFSKIADKIDRAIKPGSIDPRIQDYCQSKHGLSTAYCIPDEFCLDLLNGLEWAEREMLRYK